MYLEKNKNYYSIMKKLLIFLFLIIPPSGVRGLLAQSINPQILAKDWAARWIHVPNEPNYEFGVYHFRKTFDLTEKPSSFIVHVSADNRYKLFVNGDMVSLGPARGDIFHWNFETVDISKYLKAGKNVIAAVVWQFGEQRPMAQISFRTGFILQGDGEKEQIINTDKTWKCIRNEAYQISRPDLIYSYYVVGPQETVDHSKYPHGWDKADFDDKNWKNAITLHQGLPKQGAEWTEWWLLTPRTIPQMELTDKAFKKARWGQGIKLQPDFPYEWTEIQIPANSKVSILLDNEELANGYPAFEYNGGGKGATISMQYAESFYIDEGTKDWRSEQKKPNRNEVEGKLRLVGPKDVVVSDDGKFRTFESLWYRTFRYVKLDIETKENPMLLTNIRYIFTGYPFEMKAKLDVPNENIKKMIDVGFRTARLCATETYMDCPYYEQLQYVGDTRIQALISYYNTGDERLARNAIEQFNNSRLAEGITQSRFPSYVPQEIPPFSLWWIGMVHDYWMYRADNQFVMNQLNGTRQILGWFMKLQNADGSLQKVPYWNFTDWSEDPDWKAGKAPFTAKGESSNMDFQLLWAFQLATELEDKFGSKEFANLYRQKAIQLQQIVKQKYWDSSKKIFSDTPEWKHYSQHPNVFAVLTNTVTGAEAKALIERIIPDKNLMPCSIYFKYYLHLAARKVGLGNDYLKMLELWQQHLDYGLTTWGEMTDPKRTRSDCHAWSAHPNIEFFRIMLGIDSDAPNFEKIKVEPNLGDLKTASGSIPHPKGEISVKYLIDDKGKINAEINLPTATSGRFVWKGKQIALKSGMNKMVL
jgi:alpha-L-rhamnosidase